MAVEDVNDPCASPSIRHLDAVVHKSLPESDSCPKESPEPTAKGSPKPGPERSALIFLLYLLLKSHLKMEHLD